MPTLIGAFRMSVTLELILNRFDGKLMLNVEDLSKITGLSQITIRNQLSLGTFPIPTYLDGSRRFARADDVAKHIDRVSHPVKRRGPRTKAEKIAAAKAEASHV